MAISSCQPSSTQSPAQAPPTRTTALAPASKAGPNAWEVRSTVPEATRQGPPRIVIHNTFLVTQYVFLDQKPVGQVPPSRELAFETPPGSHVVLVSDSTDGKSNPQHIAEVFDEGFAYRYEVVPR